MTVTRLESVDRAHPRIALGQFDGIHLGHRIVIGHGRTVVCFDPHPQAVLAPHRPLVLLTSMPRKLRLLEMAGAENVVLIPFNRERASQSPASFIEDTLLGQLGVEELSVGANFRFGHRARGNVALLQADRRFTTRVVPLIEVNGQTVSSSRIRRLIAEGDIPGAASLLGSSVEIRGEVAGSDGGTSTLRLHADSPVPPRGRYRCSLGSLAGDLRVSRETDGGLPIAELAGIRVEPGTEIALELVSEPRAPVAYAARRRSFAPHM